MATETSAAPTSMAEGSRPEAPNRSGRALASDGPLVSNAGGVLTVTPWLMLLRDLLAWP